MLRKFHPNFDKMDELSQSGTPFFFLVDFLMENVEVFNEEELEESGLLIDFQNFKSYYAFGSVNFWVIISPSSLKYR